MITTLPPHHYRELVNKLRDVAEAYRGTQQLRANIERIVSKYITPATSDATRIPRTNKDYYD